MADRQEMRRGYEQAVAARRAALEAELTAERGRVTERDALLLDAICDAEMIRLEAMGQVEAKGLRERYSNGGRRWSGRTRRWRRALRRRPRWRSW